MTQFIVITTIHPKSDGITKFESRKDWNIVLIGDRKSPPITSSNNLRFLSIEEQLTLGYHYIRHCPYNHYSRKNIGYLFAAQHGAGVIYETDDDNLPYETWGLPDFMCGAALKTSSRYVNIYRHFSDEHIWPRGFPLDEITTATDFSVHHQPPVPIGIWQGLSDLSPDVDAIFRLTSNKPIKFFPSPPIALEKGHYSPSNSQNTFWHKRTFPCLYLPSTVSGRFTDILRGYVAQRLAWELDLRLGITGASVYQERNVHNLMSDFQDEVACYLHTKRIIDILDSLRLSADLPAAMLTVYASLSQEGIVSPEELPLLEAWLHDMNTFASHGGV